MTGTMIRKQLIAIALLAHLCFLRLETCQKQTWVTSKHYSPLTSCKTTQSSVRHSPTVLLQDIDSPRKWQGEPRVYSNKRPRCATLFRLGSRISGTLMIYVTVNVKLVAH
jgi:hypothetical protein